MRTRTAGWKAWKLRTSLWTCAVLLLHILHDKVAYSPFHPIAQQDWLKCLYFEQRFTCCQVATQGHVQSNSSKQFPGFALYLTPPASPRHISADEDSSCVSHHLVACECLSRPCLTQLQIDTRLCFQTHSGTQVSRRRRVLRSSLYSCTQSC